MILSCAFDYDVSLCSWVRFGAGRTFPHSFFELARRGKEKKKKVVLTLCFSQNDGSSAGPFHGATFIALLFGRTSDEGLKYSKSSALFRWLFGYDLSDTLVLFDKRGSGKVRGIVWSDFFL